MPDKWSQYAQPAAPAEDKWASYAAPADSTTPAAEPEAPGLLDQFAQWGAKTFPQISKQDTATSENDALNPNRGTAPELSRIVANTGNTVLRGATAIPAGIVDWAKQGLDPEQYLHPIEYNQKRLAQNASQPGTILQPGQKPAEPTEENYADVGSNLAGSAALGVGTGKLAEFGLGLPKRLWSSLAGDVHTPPPGSTISPAARYEAAKRLGVQLDAADATGSPLLGNLKRIGENSLAGGHLYDALKTANTGALQGSTDDFLNSLFEGDHESGGRAIQDALKRDQSGSRSGAEEGFDQLTKATAGEPVIGAPNVSETAKGLLKTIEPLADKYPSLAPGKTIHILRDLSRVGAQEVPQPTGFLDAPGSEFAVPREATASGPDTWSDLQRLRSATHDLTTTNPDLVKSQAIAPLQVMTSALDDAMTGASGGLTPQLEKLFRDSNAKWKDMKDTYDNPSSPFHTAVRTDNPSSLFTGVGEKTPENAKNLVRRLLPVSEQNPDSTALGALRRGTVESALKTTNEGAPNFRNFGANWNRISPEYRAELFTPDQNATLRDINHTSNILGKDFNPSGSAKLGQKVAEAAALVPTAGAPLLQYPLAKLMTSPRAVDILLRGRGNPNPFVAPAVAAATANSTYKRN